MSKILEETVTLPIPTQLVQKHVENIFPDNRISITNYNILAKTSLDDRFPIPYLATFSIAGSGTGRFKLHFHCSATCKQHSEFRDIQTDRCTAPSFPLPFYAFCTQSFRDIQFDHRALTSPEYPL